MIHNLENIREMIELFIGYSHLGFLSNDELNKINSV